MANASKILMTEGDAPTTPASGTVYLYPKTDHLYYTKGSDGTERPLAGSDGVSSFVYIAYASDNSGTDFTLTFNPTLPYIAILATTTEISSPVASDFSGLWVKYLGSNGADADLGLIIALGG